MADLYGTTAPTSGHEPEEISKFLNQLIHNSSSSSSSFNAKYINHSLSSLLPDADSESAALFSQLDDRHHRSADPPSSVPDSSSGGFSFSNSLTTCVAAVDSDAYDSEKGPEASEAPSNNTNRPKPPSKRSRAAEVHNMSEKRRRSRINEKMKALQNLIPNSNKTDKASMLDEAIEYLKQLQLQVQMLTMRNGLSLHPMWLPGVLQPVQLPQTGMVFDENGLLNTNRGTDTFSANEEGSIQTVFNISNQCTISSQPIAISSAANMTTSETPFGLEPLIQAHYGPFGLSSPSKDILNEGAPQLRLDVNFTGKDPSSGMS